MTERSTEYGNKARDDIDGTGRHSTARDAHSADDAINSLRIVLAADQSIRTGQIVTL